MIRQTDRLNWPRKGTRRRKNKIDLEEKITKRVWGKPRYLGSYWDLTDFEQEQTEGTGERIGTNMNRQGAKDAKSENIRDRVA